MTNEECLKKAIERAEKNVGKKLGHFPLKAELIGNYYYRIIFSHDFAKAFWGEESENTVIGQCPVWQWHLCKMVREPEPLKYLEGFL